MERLLASMKVNLFLDLYQLIVSFTLSIKLQFIVIASAIHANGVRVDTNTESSKAEIVGDAKAEALTLVIHKLVPSLPKLRPVQVIERNDDVVVIHSNRPKRRPSSRKRRPSSQYRSKIKHLAANSSPHHGFNDFSPSEFRFPPFPTKNYGEPPRSSNKYKFGPPTKPFDGYGFNAQQPPKKKTRKPTTVYGPPPSFNQFDPSYNQQFGPASSLNEKTLQTLQQQQGSFPSFSIDTVEPASTSNFYKTNANSDRFNPNSDRNANTDRFNSNSERFPHPISNFPLDSGSSFNSQKTSYGKPVRNQNQIRNEAPSDATSYQFDSTRHGSSSLLDVAANSNADINSNLNPYLSSLNKHLNHNFNANGFPKLPNRYEPNEFSTPTRTNPLGSNPFNHDFSIYNDLSESQNAAKPSNQNRNNFNKFNNFDYDYKNQRNPGRESEVPYDEDDEESLDYLYSARRPLTTTTTTTEAPTTTKRPRKNVFDKRKRPTRISQSHNLDTDDLRDAFTESSDFHEVALNSDDFISFDSQRNKRRNQNSQSLHEIPSTLKTANSPNSALRTALGDDFEIVSIHKSQERNPQEVNFGFQRKNDQHDRNEFHVGSDINFGTAAEPVMWNGDFTNFPRNHRFSA